MSFALHAKNSIKRSIGCYNGGQGKKEEAEAKKQEVKEMHSAWKNFP